MARFRDYSCWEEEGECSKLLDKNVILGKICATIHVLTFGGRAAPTWGPATEVCGPVGLEEGHSCLQGRAKGP